MSGEGVQQALLKILEGTVASVPVEGTRKHREMETVQIDTRDILFICGGAFVGLADIVAQRLGARESGFGAAWHDHEVPKRELLAQVSADDLADFGLLPEFIGRLPVVSVLEELTEDDFGPNPRRTGKRAGQAVPEAIRRRWGDVDLYRRGDTADCGDVDSAGYGRTWIAFDY